MHRPLLRLCALSFFIASAMSAAAQQSPLPRGTTLAAPNAGTGTTFQPADPRATRLPAGNNPFTANQGNVMYQSNQAPPVYQQQMPGQEAVAPVAPEPTAKTAAEQGYDGDLRAAQARALAEAADNARANSPRQRGIKITVPSLHNPVASHPESYEWLANWKDVLVEVGVHPAKVDFEAARLSQDEFSLWASRLVWALKGPGYRLPYGSPVTK